MEQIFIVETQKLSKQYGAHKRVNEISLQIRKGEIYGFLGPNGAGKTTTLKMLLGLVKPTAGDIRIFGKSLTKHRSGILRSTGSLIESPSYYGHLTGLENMRVMQRLRNVPEKHVKEALRIVRLEDQKDKKAEQYSLGMKQRLGIAMALLAFPPLLILDEPTNGLDPAGIGEIRELIKSLPRQYGITVLLSSHLLSEIEQIATSVGIISEGKLLYQGSMAKLRQKSKSVILFKTGDDARAETLLHAYGYRFTRNEGRLALENMDETEIADLNRLLVTQNIPVTRIEERTSSLEDLFLEWTGREKSL